MNRPDLWLVRHGETEWSRDGRHTGRTDIPLTPNGERLAATLRERLAGEEFDLVLSSPLQRARETARLAGFADPELDPDAVEWDYGEAEGRTTPQMQEARPGWTIWSQGPPGGETADEVGARCDRVIARVRRDAEHRAVLFAHGHVLRILGARWAELPALAGGHLLLDTAGVSVLSWERDAPALLHWNG